MKNEDDAYDLQALPHLQDSSCPQNNPLSLGGAGRRFHLSEQENEAKNSQMTC